MRLDDLIDYEPDSTATLRALSDDLKGHIVEEPSEAVDLAFDQKLCTISRHENDLRTAGVEFPAKPKLMTSHDRTSDFPPIKIDGSTGLRSSRRPYETSFEASGRFDGYRVIILMRFNADLFRVRRFNNQDNRAGSFTEVTGVCRDQCRNGDYYARPSGSDLEAKAKAAAFEFGKRNSSTCPEHRLRNVVEVKEHVADRVDRDRFARLELEEDRKFVFGDCQFFHRHDVTPRADDIRDLSDLLAAEQA